MQPTTTTQDLRLRQIPLPMAVWCINNNKINLLETFLSIRTPSGWSNLTPKDIASQTQRSIKTVRAHLAQLSQMKWIGKDQLGRIYTRSITKLSYSLTNQPTRKRIVVGLSNLRKQIILSLVGLYAKYGMYLLKNGGNKGVPLPTEHTPGLSASVIARKIGLSRSWAFKWLKALKAAKMIKIRRRKVKDSITVNELHQARNLAPELFTNCYISDQSVFRNLASIITPTAPFHVKNMRKNRDQ